MNDNSMPEAYPLHWPTWMRRIPENEREYGRFHKRERNSRGWTESKNLSMANATGRLSHQLELLGAETTILSTNVVLRLDGLPRSNQVQPDDPGAAVYFKLKGKPYVLACDKWTKVEANIAAIAAHIDAMRGQLRWGVGTKEQAFAGYKALPDPGQMKPWWEVLGVGRQSTRSAIDFRYKQLAKDHHPDVGGDSQYMAEINAAYQEAKQDTRLVSPMN